MRVVSLHAHSLDGMYSDVLEAGRVTGVLARARRLVASLQRRVVRVTRRAARAKSRPRVFCMEWYDPVFTTGHWVPELVRRAGGVDGLATAGDSRRIEWGEVVRYAPERLILMPCGLGVDRAVRDARALSERPGWRSVPAVRTREVYVVDGPSYFNGSGPRLVEGLEILAGIIHPELFERRRAVRIRV